MVATGKRFTTIQIFSGQLVCLTSAKLTETANKLEGRLFCTKQCSRTLAMQLQPGMGQWQKGRADTLWAFSSNTDFSSTAE